MNKNQQAAIKTVCQLFYIVEPKGDPTEKEVRGYYERVMREDCQCEIEFPAGGGTVRDKCRRCRCKDDLETAWPFLAGQPELEG